MVKFDFTSIVAAISFFICVILFSIDLLSFVGFCHLLLMLEGIVFLAGALSKGKLTDGDPIIELGETESDSSFVQFNRVRYIVGLILFFVGSFIDNLS